MKDFAYFQPTELLFGAGRIKEVGEVVARFGKRCLLVTAPALMYSVMHSRLIFLRMFLHAGNYNYTGPGTTLPSLSHNLGHISSE